MNGVDDAEAIRAGIRARREQRRQRRRHRVFIAAALVVAAVITIIAYASSSSGGHKDQNVVTDSVPPTTEADTSSTAAQAPPDTAFALSPGAVQWVDTPAQPPPAPAHPVVPAGTRACTAFQLDAKGSWQLNGPTVVGGIRFTNHSETPCSLHGVPDVLITDHRHIRVDLPQQPSQTPDPGPTLLPPHAADAASIGLQWTNSCAALQAPVTVRVNLPDGGSVIDVDPDGPNAFNVIPPCGNPQASATFTVDPVQPAAAPQAPPPSASLTATIRAPASVAAGSTLVYEVTLTNPTAAPVPLDPCPSYTESLAGITAGYQLNCGPVGQLPPGGSATFAMQLALPPDAPAGSAPLQWQAGGPAATAPVMVTAG